MISQTQGGPRVRVVRSNLC